ncbi:restriction endonuclease [Verrucomicrobia bacterium]|nr:restriction endonuclease [Verrucomicrobiota bacterium]
MTETYEKQLSANDLGRTGGHQAGTHIPKGNKDLVTFLPQLDLTKYNPFEWMVCVDPDGDQWKMKYIHYNNKLHGEGTRDEIRITHTARFFRRWHARVGDFFVLSKKPNESLFNISVKKQKEEEGAFTGVIKLRGWKRVF